jgi:four helix bundle protein
MTNFAAEIIKLASELPQIQPAKHVAGQLIRSGTATAANYAEARSAESLSDFIHKLRIVLKELNETEVWLELITKSSWIYPEKIIAIIAENRELCCIIAKSIQTVGGFRR